MNNNTIGKHLLSMVICLAMVAAIALTMTACDNGAGTGTTTAASGTTTTAPAATGTTAAPVTGPTEMGIGYESFFFNVVDKDGNKTEFKIATDELTVGEALLNLGLIEGEDGEFGLYVKKVNGITADYSIDGTYWALYVNGEYAAKGVDQTEVTDGATYEFRVQK
jgi:hypothetical protein